MQEGDDLKKLHNLRCKSEKEYGQRKKPELLRNKYPHKAIDKYNDKHIPDIGTYERIVNEQGYQKLYNEQYYRAYKVNESFLLHERYYTGLHLISIIYINPDKIIK